MEAPKPSAPPDSAKPQPGQTARLAANLAEKHGGGKVGKFTPPPSLGPVRPKGGRLTVAEESARHLAANGLVAVPAQAAPPSLAPAEPPAYVVTPEFVGEVTEKCLKGVENWRVANREHRVFRLVGDKTVAKEFAESSKAPPGCIDTVAKSMMEIARKYPAILQWTPEIAAAAALGTWFAKDSDVESRLAKLEAQVAAQLKATGTTPAKPATN